jgi:hypothetical protein
MPQFKSKEQYEKWKADRQKKIKKELKVEGENVEIPQFKNTKRIDNFQKRQISFTANKKLVFVIISLMIIAVVFAFFIGRSSTGKQSTVAHDSTIGKPKDFITNTSGKKGNLQTSIADKIELNILTQERFSNIENPYEKPNRGNVFLAFLIIITNNSDVLIYGGSWDYHNTFTLISRDGYVIQAENTASEAWRQNRQVWNADTIPPNETRKGWIVFQIPENAFLKYLNFRICKVNSPNRLTELDTLKISLE